ELETHWQQAGPPLAKTHGLGDLELLDHHRALDRTIGEEQHHIVGGLDLLLDAPGPWLADQHVLINEGLMALAQPPEELQCELLVGLDIPLVADEHPGHVGRLDGGTPRVAESRLRADTRAHRLESRIRRASTIAGSQLPEDCRVSKLYSRGPRSCAYPFRAD